MFNQRHNICPRYPDGTKWLVSMRSQRASCSWNMLSFQEAVDYLRAQYQHAVKATARPRYPGDQYAEREFWGYVQGPAGTIGWDDLEPLVKR